MKLLITSALLFLVISPLTQAKHNSSYHNAGKHNRHAIRAKVIESTPVYKYVTVRQPKAYCEPLAVRKISHRFSNRGAAIMGGVVGGFIGHAASDKKHKG